ncbi:hypothetical protein CC1G_06041 [Coprinopsis cinerea okayama7|uniref:Uncharacterized protein n=1 Tax=Coprinopsis cinerea (strain Okayama-7 / 130 / ATCC MYA-4618 / FGSC 9003) TaxID=240176 RepID=A8N4G4_COPC7|nr:hypothetical protein CC1G_06041 [Coprinopsis cinerea okayama7\|eukprot:XP_001829832.1 hypothetical protein CC1G_06041 [Coprinopsis cinerea okayama7\
MSSDTGITALLSHQWIGDVEGQHTLLLKEDGSGEIVSRSELTIALAAHLTWKVIDSGPVNDDDPPAQSFLGKLLRRNPPSTEALVATIELTISKDTSPMTLVPEHRNSEIGGDRILKESGLEPKRFGVVVQRGVFQPPFWRKDFGTKYALRLSFDPSPYPPVEEWSPDRRDMVESVKPFNRISFVALEIQEQ